DDLVPPHFYTDEDFNNPANPPPGLREDPRMQLIGADGSRTPLLVSDEVPVLVPPPGVGIESLLREAAVLHEMVPVLRATRAMTEDLIRPSSQYAALDASGLHMSWPGKGNYPDDYDPRRRPWFQAAINALDVVAWTPPVIDAPTGQVRITCSAPVYRDDGTLLGVVAADVALADVLRELTLPAVFRDSSQALIVQVEEDEAGLGPEIIAKAEYDELAGSPWDSPVVTQRFASDDPADSARLAERMLAEEQGSIEMRIGGAPWVWTWERLRGPSASGLFTSVLVGVALEVAEADAQNVSQSINATISSAARQNVTVGLFVLVAVVGVGFVGSRSITKPVRSLAQTAQSIAEGDLDARASVETGDELQTLADSFNSMVPKLQDRLRVRESLEIAREVQQNLLPRETPNLPGLDIAALCVYSDETGGDYFDFLDINTGSDSPSHAVLVGDVTGHGIGAALLMTTARALIHARAPESDDLPDVLGRVNANLAIDSKSGQFMTLFYLLIGESVEHGRRISWTSAGHDAAIVLNTTTGEFSELVGHDIPLGIDGSWDYHSDRAELPDRSIVVIGTDGIWEARDPSGEMFGKDRLRDIIAKYADSDADGIARAILESVIRFRDGGIQTDDVTLVVLRTGEPDRAHATPIG
ncbi:MAG: SpoIIE family protein phosphatase, partial [Planctomycetota bacterium]